MKRTVCFLFVLASLIAVLCFSSCDDTDARIAVNVMIDGETIDTLYTNSGKNFRIQMPEKPEDITTNPNAEKYFYGWFIDSDFQTPLSDTTEFRKNGTIYGKWVHVSMAGFTYTVSDGVATITGYIDSTETTPTETLVVPAYLDDFPVKYIGLKAFQGKTMLRTIALCNGITSVDAFAFAECNSLAKIEFPDSITNISNEAFTNCYELTSVTVGTKNTIYHSAGDCLIETKAKTLVLGCKNSIIPADGSVTNIGKSAFCRRSGLTSIAIPDSVTSIGIMAFDGCKELTKITIPSSVTRIGANAFTGCHGLKEIHISDIATLCKISFSYDANPLSFAHNLYLNDTLVTELIIPSDVTSIGDGAFSGCSGLTSITIPSSVTCIGDDAFEGCIGLTSITIPSSVTNIGKGAFSRCFGLTSIIIPDCITSIDDGAFAFCTGLTSIAIPNSVTSIGDSAFADCSGLTSIVIPDSVTSIGMHAFACCSGLTSITIPNSVTSIGDGAFSGCSGLTSVTLPDSITSIGTSTFYGCFGLTSITIPNSVTSIDEVAFSGCSGITSITLPNSVTNIGRYAFYGCSGLTDIYFAGSQNEWDQIVKEFRWGPDVNYTIHYDDEM